MNFFPHGREWLRSVAMACLVAGTSLAQDPAPETLPARAEYQRFVVNSDGSFILVEPLDDTQVNRLEYRNRIRPTLDVFQTDGGLEKKINIIDYDADFRPDLIRIERASDDRSVEAISFYRGPMHKAHEEGHLAHALEHSFVRRDSLLTKDIKDRLEAMRARSIRDDEIGVFTGYSLFAELDLRTIRLAFDAADSLFEGVHHISSLSLSDMRGAPELSLSYRRDIDFLLMLNPHTLGTEHEEATRP